MNKCDFPHLRNFRVSNILYNILTCTVRMAGDAFVYDIDRKKKHSIFNNISVTNYSIPGKHMRCVYIMLGLIKLYVYKRNYYEYRFI